MKYMEDLKVMLCDELGEIARKGELSPGDLETAHKLTDTIKNIDKITYMDENGYSMNGDWRASGNYGDSYGRHYVRGHYSRGRYSMSDEKRHLVDQMRDMMRDESMSADERNSFRRAMDALE